MAVEGYLPPVVTKFLADLTDLAKGVATGKVLIADYARESTDVLSRAGTDSGRLFAHNFVTEVGAGMQVALKQTVRDSANMMGNEGAKAFSSAGAKTARSFVSSFSSMFWPIIIGSLILLSPHIVTALASAIISGVLLAVGGGVLAAGIVSAAKDQRVISAWKNFGDHAAKTFQRFGQPFIGPLTRAADTFVAALKRAEPTILAIGRTMAPIIDKLAPGVAGMFEKMLPGVARVAEASKPFLERLLDPRLGEAIGKFFENIAKGAPSALAFFDKFMNWVETTLPKLGGFLTWLSDLGAKMDSFTNTELSNLKTALDSFKDDTLAGVKDGLGDIKESIDANSESWKEISRNVAEFIEGAGPAFKLLAQVVGEAGAVAIDVLAELWLWISRILAGLTKIDDLYRRLTGKEVLKSAPKLPGSPGGFQGFASGGFGKGLAITGEHGRELVDLGAGSRVYNNRDTEKMLAGAGGPKMTADMRTATASAGSGSSGPSMVHTTINVDGKAFLTAITPAAQRRKARTGETGLG